MASERYLLILTMMTTPAAAFRRVANGTACEKSAQPFFCRIFLTVPSQSFERQVQLDELGVPDKPRIWWCPTSDFGDLPPCWRLLTHWWLRI